MCLIEKYYNGKWCNWIKNGVDMVWSGGDCYRLGNSLFDKCFKMYEVCFF